jgi:hypothetical protein
LVGGIYSTFDDGFGSKITPHNIYGNFHKSNL